MLNKLAADHPSWQYVIMAKSWRQFRDLEEISIVRYAEDRNKEGFTPTFDNKDEPGVIKALEDVLIEFNTAHRKNNLDEMWMIIAAIAHWLDHPDACPWYLMRSYDSEEYTHVVGTALVTALEHVDRAGELKQDPKYLDLGLVVARYLRWSIIPQWIPRIGADIYWRPTLVAYAKKAGIDLGTQGIYDVASLQSRVRAIEPLKSKRSGDRWKWAKTFEDIKCRRT